MTKQQALIETITGLVVFEIAGREFCTDIKDVSAIINPFDLNQSDDLVLGEDPYVKINNYNIPVIPLHQYFGMELKEVSEDRRILVVEPDDTIIGFFVEKVNEIFTMSSEFKNKLMFSPVTSSEYLSGIINYEGRIFYLVDFEKILINK